MSVCPVLRYLIRTDIFLSSCFFEEQKGRWKAFAKVKLEATLNQAECMQMLTHTNTSHSTLARSVHTNTHTHIYTHIQNTYTHIPSHTHTHRIPISGDAAILVGSSRYSVIGNVRVPATIV